MPLPKSVEREHLHTRKISCEGYLRKDGLWDLEAHLTDTKTFGFDTRHRGYMEPGAPVHGLHLRVTMDLDFVIHDVVAVSDDTPYPVCKKTAEAMRELIGIKIGPGWMREVRNRVERKASCTHLMELLGPLATTAYQTMHSALEERANQQPVKTKPRILDTCIALASDGPEVKARWPEFYTGPRDTDDAS